MKFKIWSTKDWQEVCNNDPPRRYDIITLKFIILILSKSSINLITKLVENFSQYTFTK